MNKNNQLLIFLILLVAFAEFFKLPYNAYLLLKRPYEERMIRNYGYCDKEGYGYVKKILREYKSKNFTPTIINKNPTPTIYALLNLKPDDKISDIILINYKETEKENIYDMKIKKIWFEDAEIDIKNYELRDREGDCFYFSKWLN